MIRSTKFVALLAILSFITFESKGNAMEKVTGIGGFFFRSDHPKTLAKWYFDNLGINLDPQKPGDEPWQQEAGPTAFVPFENETTMIPKKKTSSL